MRRSTVLLVLGLVLAVAGLPVTGCTAIGYNIGASIDERNAGRRTVRVADLGEVEPGDTCRLTRTDGCVFTGRYGGLRMVPRSEFLQAYNQWKAADTTRKRMPSLGDSVEVVWTSSARQPLRGRIAYISADSLRVRRRSDAAVFLTEAALRDIQTVSSAKSGSIDGQQIRENTADPAFPRAARFVLTIDGQEIATPVDSIAVVAVVRTTNPVGWRIAGTSVGLIVDLVAAYFLFFGVIVLGMSLSNN